MTDLNSLARTLAERLQAELSICMETEPCEVCINGAEAVIREAIDKTLDEAEKVAQAWADSKSCEHHDNNPCCHVRTGAGIAAAIRSLKQSNSGMEVRK